MAPESSSSFSQFFSAFHEQVVEFGFSMGDLDSLTDKHEVDKENESLPDDEDTSQITFEQMMGITNDKK